MFGKGKGARNTIGSKGVRGVENNSSDAATPFTFSFHFFFLKSPNPDAGTKANRGTPGFAIKRGLERITGPTLPAGPHVTDSNSRGTLAGAIRL